jgi:single-strand DNA-binding protein
VAGFGCSVGACGTARKPLAALGLGLTAALRVRAVRAGGAGSRLVSHTIRPDKRGKEGTMNRWTGTGHLTKDPKFLETENGTAICTLRLAVKRAGKQGHDGYFDVKCFDGQASACAQYLKAGREVAVDGRLLFDEFQTQDGGYASRVYIVAERVEFLASRKAPNGQASEASADQPATEGAAREAHEAA